MKAVGCTLEWGDGHRRGELRGERWSGERSGLKCVKDREGDLTRKRLCDEGSVRRCCENDGRLRRRDRKLLRPPQVSRERNLLSSSPPGTRDQRSRGGLSAAAVTMDADHTSL